MNKKLHALNSGEITLVTRRSMKCLFPLILLLMIGSTYGQAAAQPALPIVQRTNDGVVLAHEETVSRFGATWELDFYRNTAYDAGLSGNYTFLVVEPLDNPGGEAPLWVYLHGGGVGYFDEQGVYHATGNQTQDTWNHEETFEDLRKINPNHPIIDKNGQPIDNTVTRRIKEGYRLLVVSMSDHDLYSGLGTPYPNNPNGGEVNGLQATMAAIDFTVAIYSTTHVFAHGTSAGGHGVWGLAVGCASEGIPLTGVVADSGLTTPRSRLIFDAFAGVPRFPYAADFDLDGVVDKIGVFVDDTFPFHPEAQVRAGFDDVPILFIGGDADPRAVGGNQPAIAEAAAAGLNNVDWVYDGLRQAIADQPDSPHQVSVIDGAGHVPTNKPGVANDIVDDFISQILSTNPPHPFGPDRASAAQNGPDKSLALQVPVTDAKAAIPRFDSIVDLSRADAPLKAEDVPFVRGEQSVKPCAFFPGTRMRQIELKFTSPLYRGRTSEHAAVVFLPEGEIPQHAQGAAAIILDGRVAIGKKPELDWVEHLVVDMGVPCIVVMQMLDPKPFGATDPGHLMSMGSATFLKTGDAREAGYYALARILSAAATVGAELPELQANRFIATGCSKRGMAALIACAGDPRIVAAFPTGWNSGNIPEYTRLKGERWGWDVKPMKTGPAGESAREALRQMQTPEGQYLPRLFDPSQWGEILEDKFVMPAVGTNDPLFHLLSDQFYFDDLKCRRAFLRVINYKHGRKGPDLAAGWRFAVAAGLLGQDVPSVRIRVETARDTASVVATLSGVAQAKSLTLLTAADPTGDYRKAQWRSADIAPLPSANVPTTIAELDVPEDGVLAVYARIVAEGDYCDSVNCSNIVEIGEPAIVPYP